MSLPVEFTSEMPEPDHDDDDDIDGRTDDDSYVKPSKPPTVSRKDDSDDDESGDDDSGDNESDDDESDDTGGGDQADQVDDSSEPDEEDEDADSTATYTVKPGDSLSVIAQRVLGNGNRWNEIFQLNRDKLSNPDLIHPGQVLQMPD